VRLLDSTGGRRGLSSGLGGELLSGGLRLGEEEGKKRSAECSGGGGRMRKRDVPFLR